MAKGDSYSQWGGMVGVGGGITGSGNRTEGVGTDQMKGAMGGDGV